MLIIIRNVNYTKPGGYFMNSLERVTTIMNNKEADHVPVYPILSGASRRLIGADYKTWATDADVCAKALIKVTEDFDLDAICTLTDLSVEAEDFGQPLIYPESEAAHPDKNNQILKSKDDYYTVKRFDPTQTPRMSEHIKLCKILVEEKGEDTPIIAFVFGPLGILSMLRGAQDMFMDLYDYPEAIHYALNEITETLIPYYDAIIDTGVHGIMFDTLYASTSIMSKDMWMDYEGKYVQKLADHIRSRGCMVMVHNCGLGVYFEEQIEMMKPTVFSFLHLPPGCSSFEEVKEKYGSKTTLMGCIDPPWIANANNEEVAANSKELIDAMAKDGGFILSTGCEYPANAPLDAARVMVETAKTYGKY